MRLQANPRNKRTKTPPQDEDEDDDEVVVEIDSDENQSNDEEEIEPEDDVIASDIDDEEFDLEVMWAQPKTMILMHHTSAIHLTKK